MCCVPQVHVLCMTCTYMNFVYFVHMNVVYDVCACMLVMTCTYVLCGW